MQMVRQRDYEALKHMFEKRAVAGDGAFATAFELTEITSAVIGLYELMRRLCEAIEALDDRGERVEVMRRLCETIEAHGAGGLVERPRRVRRARRK